MVSINVGKYLNVWRSPIGMKNVYWVVATYGIMISKYVLNSAKQTTWKRKSEDTYRDGESWIGRVCFMTCSMMLN